MDQEVRARSMRSRYVNLSRACFSVQPDRSDSLRWRGHSPTVRAVPVGVPPRVPRVRVQKVDQQRDTIAVGGPNADLPDFLDHVPIHRELCRSEFLDDASDLVRNARRENVGKYQSCMVSKLRMICRLGRHSQRDYGFERKV